MGIWLLATGCGLISGPEETGEPFVGPTPTINPYIGNEPITLEVWLDLDFTRDDLFTEIAADFERSYPQVTVNIQSFVGESIPQNIRQAVLTSIPPDVAQGHVYAMAGQGLALPLDDMWTEWGPEMEAQFLPAAMAEVTWQDSRYGVPLDIYTLVLLYNKQHFDEANLSYPEGDYDAAFLHNAAATLTDSKKERYGMGLTVDPRYVYPWIASAGGDLVAETAEEGKLSLTLNSETNIDAMRFLTNIAKAGYGPLPTTRPRDYEDARQLFLEGKVSMYIGGPWDIHLIQSSYPDFPLGVAQLPKTPAADRAASMLGSTGLFIPRGARHPNVAREFIKWVTSERYALAMARRLGRYPARSWLQTSPYFTENLLLRPFLNQLNAARPYRLDLFPRAEEAFTEATKQIFYGLSPAEALNEAQQIGQQSIGESFRE